MAGGARGTAFAVRGMLGAAGLPCKCAAHTDCWLRQPPGAGRIRVHAAFARGNTCACCPSALDLASSQAISCGPRPFNIVLQGLRLLYLAGEQNRTIPSIELSPQRHEFALANRAGRSIRAAS